MQVKETDSSVILSTNVLFGVQSILMKHEKLTGMYYDYALAAPLMAGISAKNPGDILILGLGTGTFAKYCSEYFPGCSIEGVEIDEKIADLATEYFELPESVQVSVHDGRSYLASSEKKYDVIMVDAYQDITIPFQMSSVEFFTEVREHLKPEGVMVVNMNMKSRSEHSINDYLCDTMGAVFDYVYTAPVTGGTNCEVFAFQSPKAMETFEAGRASLEEEALFGMMETVLAQMELREPGNLILTDDKAPVELLGMQVLDEIIGDELEYYRELYLGEIF